MLFAPAPPSVLLTAYYLLFPVYYLLLPIYCLLVQVVPMLECKSLLAQGQAVIPQLKALPDALKEQLANYCWEGTAQGTENGRGAAEGERGPGVPLVCFLGVLRETSQAVFALALEE